MILDQLYSDFKSKPYTFFQYTIEKDNKKYLFEIIFNINKKIISKYEFTYILHERFNLYTEGNQKINFKRLNLPEFQNKNLEITNENEYDFLINELGNRTQHIQNLYKDQFNAILKTLAEYNFKIIVQS